MAAFSKPVFVLFVNVILWLSYRENSKPVALARTELWPFPQETIILTCLRKLTTKLLPVVGCWWSRCLPEALDTLIVWYQNKEILFAGRRCKRPMKFCCFFRKNSKIRGYARIDEFWTLDAGRSDQQVAQALNVHCSIIYALAMAAKLASNVWNCSWWSKVLETSHRNRAP